MGWGSSIRWELMRAALPLCALAWVVFGTAGNRWTQPAVAREDYRYWEFRCSCGDGPWRYIGREPEARARLAVLRAAGHKGDGHDLEMRGREL